MRTAIDTIKEFEGCKLSAYPDPATGGKPYTIGWGRTTDVKLGQTITQTQADAWLIEEYDEFEQGVRKLITNGHTTLYQLGAMTSLAYNIGLANFKSSTLLRKHNSGDFDGAEAEFKRWNRAAGKVMAGLVRRRAAEAALYAK